MRWLRRIGLALAGAAVLWLVGLWIAGWAAAGWQKSKAEARLASRLHAGVTIGDLDLGLIGGTVGVDHIHVARDDGKLRIDVGRVDAGIPPLGASLWQHGLGDVTASHVDVELAPGGIEPGQPSGRPLSFARFELRDATVRFRYGLSVAVHIDRAVAGATTLRTALSWVFALRSLEGTVELPIGKPIPVHFADNVLRVEPPGRAAFEVRVELPTLDPGREKEQLEEIGAAMVSAIAKAW